MMRKYITRTIPVATINAYSVIAVDGKPVVTELPPVEAYGKPTEDEAIKAVKDVHGKNIVVTIGSIDIEERVYRCPVGAFVSVAERVEDGENAEEIEAEENN